MAQIHDEDIVSGVHPALQFLRLQPRGDQLIENHAAANDAHHQEPGNAHHQQCSAEPARPVQQMGIAVEQVAEEAASAQQCAHPKNGPGAVEEDEAAVRHSLLPGHGRRQRRQAGHKLRDQQRHAVMTAVGILGLADTDARFQRELAQQAHDPVSVVAADKEPGAIGDQRCGQSRQQGQDKAELPLGRECARCQQNRRSGQWNAQLLHQHPAKEQKIAVEEQNVLG